MNNLLPDPLQTQHIVAFDFLAKQRLEAIQQDRLFIYLIDTVDESALYWLAKQFNVLGFKGWKLADTIEKKRALIKKAIELYRYKGTVWAVREALRSVGFPNAIIFEHWTHWATFKIQLNVGNNQISPEVLEEVAQMVFEYKNARSHFAGIELELTEEDEIIMSDDSYEGPPDEYEDTIYLGGDFIYNGDNNYNGDRNYSSDTDTIDLTII